MKRSRVAAWIGSAPLKATVQLPRSSPSQPERRSRFADYAAMVRERRLVVQLTPTRAYGALR